MPCKLPIHLNFKSFIIFCLLLIAFSFIFSSLNAAETVRWISFPDPAFEVNGLPWFSENAPDLFRLPKRLKDRVRPPVWSLATNPSGGRIRFRSDCTTLCIRLEYPDLSRMQNMHTYGQSGVDLYIDGNYVRTAIPADSTFVEFSYFEGIGKRTRDLTIYLSLYKGVKVLAIGVNPEARIMPHPPFILDKPVVYYGTSITQGGCASRPGMSYQAMIGRDLNIDFVNLGFSGNGRGEPELARAMTEIDAACYVLDFGLNNRTADSLALVFGPFLDILRREKPGTPVIAVSPPHYTNGFWFFNDNPNNREMRDVIQGAVADRIRKGDRLLYFVDGFDLLGPELADGVVDGGHPNDLGFRAMADGLIPTLIRVLNLADSR